MKNIFVLACLSVLTTGALATGLDDDAVEIVDSMGSAYSVGSATVEEIKPGVLVTEEEVTVVEEKQVVTGTTINSTDEQPPKSWYKRMGDAFYAKYTALMEADTPNPSLDTQ
jgi:hypothetical protein